MTSRHYIVDVPADTLERIRCSETRYVTVVAGDDAVLQAQPGDQIYFRWIKRSTVVRVLSVKDRVISFERPWPHGDGDPVEESIAAIERICRQLREAAHDDEPEKMRSIAGDLHNNARVMHLGFGGYRERA